MFRLDLVWFLYALVGFGLVWLLRVALILLVEKNLVEFGLVCLNLYSIHTASQEGFAVLVFTECLDYPYP